MLDFFRSLLSTDSFMPHGHCYLWRPEILWLHVISDAIIGLAYASIPFALIYLVRRRKDLAFNWVFVMFGIFILACGATHFISIWTVWDPVYRLDGLVKALTAVASLATAAALWPLLPKVLVLPSPTQLATANRGLQLEIVERKKAEEALAERNRALIESERLKGEFIAKFSHELRTPLSLILAPIESLRLEPQGLSPAHRETLDIVHNNAVRLLQMVNSLLDFSKLEANKIEVVAQPTDVALLTRSLLADFVPAFEAKRVALRLSPEATPLLGEIDRYLFERILFNLLSNALKFTPEGGSVDVALERRDRMIALSVTDTGVGISESDLGHLFQKFRQLEGSSTRRFEGTGLGLALVKEFAELLGGQVGVESQPGRGSRFTVTLASPEVSEAGQADLPASRRVRKRTTPVARAPEPADGDSGLPKVVVAEDNTELADYIGTLLRGTARVRFAKDGREALAVSAAWEPDLVLSDVMMPGMDGLEVCRALKSDPATAKVTVVLLTAMTHREALMRGWEAGADEYLFKPFHPTELVTRVASLLAGRDARKRADEREIALAREAARREEAEASVLRLERTEAELRRANRVKDEFLAIVSHELRTPLNSVLGWAQLLKDGDVPVDELQVAFETLYRNAKSQAKLTEDILDFSRIMTGKLQLAVEPVRVSEVVAEAMEAVRLAATAKDLRLETDYDGSHDLIAGDRDRLRQVVWNLLANAIKFSPKGSTVRVRTTRADSKASVTVVDEGEGIDPAFLPHVFEKFLQADGSHTRVHGGLGLGLSIVKYLVELHGGDVAAASEGRGKGATFSVALPILAVRNVAPGSPKDRTEPSHEGRGSKKLQSLTVLVIDDDRDARELVATVLRKQGATVLTADSVAGGLDAFARHGPDLVLSDLSMPEQSGWDLVRRIRERERPDGKHVPVMVLTAHAGPEIARRCAEAGFDRLLTKPVDSRELVNAILEVSNRSAAGFDGALV